jgi:hypothetical protein
MVNATRQFTLIGPSGLLHLMAGILVAWSGKWWRMDASWSSPAAAGNMILLGPGKVSLLV